MRKNTLTFIMFVLIGMLAGTIIGELLSQVPMLAFLTRSTDLEWAPSADLGILKYDLHFWFKINLASILGIAAALWIYRKL